MTEMVFALSSGIVFSFGVYWYLKFKHILPIEKKVFYIDAVYSRFREFSLEISRQSYIPETLEEFSELINHHLIKLHSFFPSIAAAVFERENKKEIWKISHAVAGEKINSSNLGPFVYGLFNKCLNDGDILLIDETDKNFEGLEFKSLALFPFVTDDKKVVKIIMIGISDKSEFQVLAHYVKYLSANLSAHYKIYERNMRLKRENEQLKRELNAVLKELDMAGSRLIRKAKERKAIYDVVSMSKGDLSKSVDNIVSVAARVLEADMAAFLFYDEDKKSLETYGRPYWNFEDSSVSYSLPLDDLEKVEVRSFIEKKTFVIEDVSVSSQSATKVTGGEKIKSLVVMPVYLNENMIGVLEMASRKRDFFNQEHLEFISAISNQISEIMSILSLYKNLSSKAQELSQMNKIKDEFLSTVSHELKTPLTTIKGFISVLLSGEVGAMSEQQVSFLNIVDQAANRLSSLITNLLDISRLDGKINFDLSPFDLIEAVKTSMANLSVKALEKNMKLEFVSDNLKYAYVTGDRHWLMQVVDNLVMNAIKYSHRDSDIKVVVSDRGDVVVVSVEDSGPGIDISDQKLIFNKFYRGKNAIANTQGTGLGLSICKSIIEKHNGKIWVESQPGKGAKFFFALPKVKTAEKKGSLL